MPQNTHNFNKCRGNTDREERNALQMISTCLFGQAQVKGLTTLLYYILQNILIVIKYQWPDEKKKTLFTFISQTITFLSLFSTRGHGTSGDVLRFIVSIKMFFHYRLLNIVIKITAKSSSISLNVKSRCLSDR